MSNEEVSSFAIPRDVILCWTSCDQDGLLTVQARCLCGLAILRVWQAPGGHDDASAQVTTAMREHMQTCTAHPA